MRLYRGTFALTLIVCHLAVAPAVLAVDGVLEINQACVAAGCFPGDAPGFPVEITEAGSYRLTGNLEVPDENTTAIDVTAFGARGSSIDLNGFTISGITDCISQPTCSPTGLGRGIDGGRDITVRNGFVRSMGNRGISLGTFARVQGVTAFSNGAVGIVVRSRSRVVDCVARDNGVYGILATFADTFDFGSLVKECVVFGNGDDGILAARGSSLIDNLVEGNGGDGIQTGGGSLVLGNRVFQNQGYGLSLSTSGSGYADNSVSFNNGGNQNQQVSQGVEIGTNICGTDTNCP